MRNIVFLLSGMLLAFFMYVFWYFTNINKQEKQNTLMHKSISKKTINSLTIFDKLSEPLMENKKSENSTVSKESIVYDEIDITRDEQVKETGVLLKFHIQKNIDNNDLNIRGDYLHMAADAGMSLGVVIAGIAIMYTGWLWLDPVISLLIVFVILIGTWGLLRDSVNLSIDAAPKDVDVSQIKDYFLSQENITDLHVWALSTTENALTVHLLSTDTQIDNAFIESIQEYLHHEFKIYHCTIQTESTLGNYVCALNKEECKI